MKRQWANSYILIIFDECAFLMRVLQTQTRVRNFRMLVSHTFFGTHISGLHCMSVYKVLCGHDWERGCRSIQIEECVTQRWSRFVMWQVVVLVWLPREYWMSHDRMGLRVYWELNYQKCGVKCADVGYREVPDDMKLSEDGNDE